MNTFDTPAVLNENYVSHLSNVKWKAFLDAEAPGSPSLKGPGSKRLRENTAVVLESQLRQLKLDGLAPRNLLEETPSSGNFVQPTYGNYDNNGVGGTTLPAYNSQFGSRGGFGVGSHYQTTGQPQHPNDFYAPGDTRIPQTLLPMVRRIFPALMGNEIYSVQPMSSPVGLIFGLRYKYDNDPLSCLGPNDSFCPTSVTNTSEPWWSHENKEVGYNFLNTSHTGATASGMTGHADFEMLDADKGAAAILSYFEFSNKVSGLTLEIEKTAVEAGTRRIATKWSLEHEQDLKAMHGLNIDDELVSAMGYELQAEIDRELLMRNIQLCLSGTFGKQWSYWKPFRADGRWFAEKNAVLHAKILREAQLISIRNRMGSANWLVVTPTVASVLQTLPAFRNFEIKDVDVSLNNQLSTSRIGVLGNMRVYVDNRTEAQYQAGERSSRVDYILLGYNGPKAGESGIIFAPYVPVMIQRTTGVNDFSPRLGMTTRYGIADHLYGSANFYHLIIVQGLDFTGNNNCAPASCEPSLYQ